MHLSDYLLVPTCTLWVLHVDPESLSMPHCGPFLPLSCAAYDFRMRKVLLSGRMPSQSHANRLLSNTMIQFRLLTLHNPASCPMAFFPAASTSRFRIAQCRHLRLCPPDVPIAHHEVHWPSTPQLLLSQLSWPSPTYLYVQFHAPLRHRCAYGGGKKGGRLSVTIAPGNLH